MFQLDHAYKIKFKGDKSQILELQNIQMHKFWSEDTWLGSSTCEPRYPCGLAVHKPVVWCNCKKTKLMQCCVGTDRGIEFRL